MGTESVNLDVVVPKIDAILARGLSQGLGDRDGQMCIEAAVCAALDLPHGDDPPPVTTSVSAFKVQLNDRLWSSPQARAQGLRRLGIAQLGSRGVVDDRAFVRLLASRTIRILVPAVLRACLPDHTTIRQVAEACEREGTGAAARAAYDAATAYGDVHTAATAIYAGVAFDLAAVAASPYAAATTAAASYVAYAAAVDGGDRWLVMAAAIAFDVLVELQSPGALWLLAHETGDH